MHDIFVSTQSINQFKHCEVASHFQSPIVSTRTIWRYLASRLLTLPAYSMQSRVYESVRPSVCPIGRQQQGWPAGLLLSALWAGDIDQ